LVLAVAVAAADTLDRLRGDVERIVCLKTPGWFRSIRAHYANFGQTPDFEGSGCSAPHRIRC
jgi:putative phosphoribosyl transferase